MKSCLKQKMILVLSGLVVGLGFFEIGVRIFWHSQLAAWQRNIEVILPINSKDLHGIAGPIHIDTNSKGIRGREWSKDRNSEYRILAIGGSTTECLLQDQPNTWPALLEKKLSQLAIGKKIWVGNVGHGGFHSRHHVLEMQYMLQQYAPDAVVILMGGNDMGILLEEGMAYDPYFTDDEKKMDRLAISDFPEQPLSILERHGGFPENFFYFYLFLKTRWRYWYQTHGIKNNKMIHNAELYSKKIKARQNPWLVIDQIPDLKRGLQGFERNIRKIIELAKARKIQLIFMTQPALYKPIMNDAELKQIWAGWVGRREANMYWSTRVLGTVIDANNSILLKVSKQEKIPCIDLALSIPRSQDVFFDHVHFTDYGSELVANELTQHFKSYFNVKTSFDRVQRNV